MDQSVILGIDIGGTFTDVVCLNTRSGTVKVAKTPTTLPNQADGLISGVRAVVDDAGEIAIIVHGTTIATNAVLERKIASTGLIATAGFRDVLEMRRRQRPRTYGLVGSFDPIVPRHMRLEVRERVASDGTVQESLDDAEVAAVVEKIRMAGAEALAVCFINSFANPENENRAVELVRRYWPEAFVCSSADVLPEIKEFERTSTTVLNAAVQPVVDRYLSDVEKKLAATGCKTGLSIVQSNGGIASVAATRQKPVTTILSGPAAGVTGANYIATRAGFKDIVTFDMGGTSLDAAVVVDGQPHLASETTIDFGVVMKIPMIQMTTIGAGGGSIAHIDGGGFLQIGPESAGADPGPVAYGRGGTRATVTDSNLVMGRINANRPIGNSATTFDIDSATRALAEQVGKPLKLSAHAAAEAVVSVANTRMAGAVRLATVEKGHDPRRFTLVAFGGAGPLHAGAVIREVGIPRALIPYFPGLTSAIGCAVGNIQYDFVQTFNRLLADESVRALSAIWEMQRRAGSEVLEAGSHLINRTETVFGADMQFEGQTHTLLVSFGKQPESAAEIHRMFVQRYKQTFGVVLDLPIIVTNARMTIVGVRESFDFSSVLRKQNAGAGEALRGRRQVWFRNGFVETQVYERACLPPGTVIHGPAVIEQADSTIWVDPDLVAAVDEDLNIIMEVTG